jgi:hypothetical protein
MKPLVMIAVLSSAVWAQDAGLKARELFYSPPPDTTSQPPAKKSLPARIPQTRPTPGGSPGASPRVTPVANVANVPLGLRYSVLKRDGSGKFVEVDPDSSFRSGDAIRLTVDANSSGYLYVVAQGPSGKWKPLFPSEEAGGGSNRIERGSSQQIPPADMRPLVFDQQTGTEKLFLVLSRKPEPDLDTLIYSITGGGSSGDKKLMAQATVGDDVVSRLRQEVKSRDLVFEKIDEMSIQTNGSEVKTEKATYVVNPSRTDDARLVVDVALKHGK